MIISSENSQKIRVLNLVLIMMVLFFHGYYNEVEAYPFARAVQVIGSGNMVCANPVCSTVSIR